MAARHHQRNSSVRHDTRCPLLASSRRYIRRMGHTVHRGILLHEEQDIRHHRRGTGTQSRCAVRLLRPCGRADSDRMRFLSTMEGQSSEQVRVDAAGTMGDYCDLHGMDRWQVHHQRNSGDGGGWRHRNRHALGQCQLVRVRQGVEEVWHWNPKSSIQVNMACNEVPSRCSGDSYRTPASDFPAHYLWNRLRHT